MIDAQTPQKAANRLSKLLEHAAQFGQIRFPVDVPMLAKEAANIFKWSDPITEIEGVDIKGFEGMLFPNDGKTAWKLLYNSKVTSEGRIRFTQAHELGHYILHRQLQDRFQCMEDDMHNWSNDEADIEAQADLFASYLLMPLNDYREQLNAEVDFDLMGHCANRYGVSLTAAVLKWLEHTDENAVFVVSRDGYMTWAKSSQRAFKAGAFFKTSSNVIEVPVGSLAANTEIAHDRRGVELPGQIWFPHADKNMVIKEMKVWADQYDCVYTILKLPRSEKVWAPWTSHYE